MELQIREPSSLHYKNLDLYFHKQNKEKKEKKKEKG